MYSTPDTPPLIDKRIEICHNLTATGSPTMYSEYDLAHIL